MRPPQKNRNNRNKNGRKPVGNVLNRVHESAGPEGKVRGTPQQIIEKYTHLARDAQTSGDRVKAENFLQHAEHYVRLLNTAQAQIEERRAQSDAAAPRDGADAAAPRDGADAAAPRDGADAAAPRDGADNGGAPAHLRREADAPAAAEAALRSDGDGGLAMIEPEGPVDGGPVATPENAGADVEQRAPEPEAAPAPRRRRRRAPAVEQAAEGAASDQPADLRAESGGAG